ncbi:hypothetical protein DID77_01645 [Candidatus Marinamargulisbacteria bacterium SCGC AG-439-L15]|nr:hypothetical protein DID77_01645 [Candidatus Marinamargulisbacteria bacterium SCGC AG-439-L15]
MGLCVSRNAIVRGSHQTQTPHLLSHPILSSAPLSLSLTGIQIRTHEARRYLVSMSEEIGGPEVLSASEKGEIKAYVETTFNGELAHTKKEISTYLETAVSLRLDFYGEEKHQISLYWILKSEFRTCLGSSSTREALKKDGWTSSDFKKAFPNFFSKGL